MDNFTPIASLVGGLLIGLSATVLFLFNGRIAGISGLVAGVLFPDKESTRWRVTFLVGLLLGGGVMCVLRPETFANELGMSVGGVALAGLLVGVGTRIGGGCTSGHGVCGLGRLSKRSLAATLTFMATGAATVFVIRHVLGGAS
jgi:uncharacterized membrane protein YedE/YeeE